MSEDPPAVWKLLKAPSEACGCKDEGGAEEKPQEFRVVTPTRGAQRKVSGASLADLLELDLETAHQIADQEVEVEPEAWRALQAIRRSAPRYRALQRRLAKRRAVAPPDEHNAPSPAGVWDRVQSSSLGWSEDAPEESYSACATCDVAIQTWARFVDVTDGDDARGGGLALEIPDGRPTVPLTFRLTLRPWKTLRRVEQWLASAVYRNHTPATTCVEGAKIFLRAGQTWNGSEETGTVAGLTYKSWASPGTGAYGESSILTISDFKATADSPLTFSAYGDGAAPLLDGTIDSAGASAEPQYGDNRVGVQFYNCCHVYMSGIDLRGFGTAIDIRGGSKDHTYAGMNLYDNATYGIRFGVTQWDVEEETGYEDEEAYAAVDTAIIDQDLYPEDIKIDGCTLYSNGYDTQGADISIGYLSTGCTISANTMYGDDARGVDGIVSQGGSSGHVIDGNEIYLHSKYCYATSKDKTVIADAAAVSTAAGTVTALSACPSTTPTLFHSCAKDTDTTTCAGTSAYGYDQYYYSDASSGASATIEALNDAQEAFGEDGIDLKSVRDRTGDGTAVTVVSNNTIYGHPNHAGITINDGSSGIHVYNNRVYANAIGILVSNDANSGTWYEVESASSASGVLETSNIYVYRNLIFANAQDGIQVTSGMKSTTVYPVSGVYIVNNTIAHNYLTGVSVVIDDDAADGKEGDVDGIYLYNNLIARNGIGETADYEAADAMQVAWDKRIDLSGEGVTTFVSDYNVYLAWEYRTVDDRLVVIRGHSSLSASSSASEAITIDEAQTSTNSEGVRIWAIEENGGQATTLGDLGLVDAASMESIEGTRGGDLSSDLAGIDSAGGLANVISLGSDLMPEYEIATDATSATSMLINAGTTTTDAFHVEDSAVDVALSPDIAGSTISDGSPDVGAYEGPAETSSASASMTSLWSGWRDHA